MADLKEEVFKLVDVQPERRMQVMSIQNHICAQFVEHHAGEVRFAIRMLVDEDRAQLISGNILVLN
jgi:hypothetical protein